MCSSDLEIRPDPSLEAEFSPAPLIELVEHVGYAGIRHLCWRSPEMIASDKASQAFHEKLHSGGSVAEARQEARRVYAANLHSA